MSDKIHFTIESLSEVGIHTLQDLLDRMTVWPGRKDGTLSAEIDIIPKETEIEWRLIPTFYQYEMSEKGDIRTNDRKTPLDNFGNLNQYNLWTDDGRYRHTLHRRDLFIATFPDKAFRGASID